jgi:hypothetical protein
VLVDSGGVQEAADQGRLVIASQGTDQGDLGTKGAEHCGHAGRAAESVLAMVGPEQGDGGFLADPFGVAPDVAVEDQVADDQNPRLSEFLNAADQIVSHRAAVLSLTFWPSNQSIRLILF